MDDDAPLWTIGRLAARTGVPVKTIRFWSDRGLVTPSGRTDAGYRLYDEDALARLELVRTLRELGIDLATIGRVLARESSLADVAAAHADALDAQIRTLRLRRTILRLAADREASDEEMRIMHELARLGADERRRIIADFLDEVFGDLDVDPGLAARMRAATPELPDDPTPAQVDAWVELAQLVRDEGFRGRIRQMAEEGARERNAGSPASDPEAMQRTAGLVAERGGAALAAGIHPAAPAARPIVAEIAGAFAQTREERDGPAFRAELADRIESGTDARAERYWQLLAIVNGWPEIPTTVPAWEWTIAALRAS